MASFTIDTGIEPRGPSFGFGDTTMMDAVLDALPSDATQAQIDDRIVQMILGDLRKPKTLKTVRARLMMHWHLIAPLAEREPAQFDAVLLEYAELTTVLR